MARIRLKIYSKKTPYFFGSALKKAREKANLTQQQMASRCCWGLTTQKRLEWGVHELTRGMLDLIEDALNQ